MWAEDYKWHYDYVRLAWDTGFSFDKCKYPNLDKNKICVVDIDQIVRERDVASVDCYISTVVKYILDDEQTKVLDTNFVKIFRLSQLAVEFLLFCKKYLDSTVVLLKRELTKTREENKELKTFVDDLQSHIDTIVRQQALASFKCSICSKAFSSDEYLNAHVKRRHTNQNTESYNAETDTLNLEIKQLKERLNNTEKLLKEKEEHSSEKYLYYPNNNGLKIDELLEKFEQFKEKVDIELQELRLQKSFYEENYGKLFDIMTNNKENKEVPKAETTTQTDKFLHIENVHDRNVLEIHEPCSTDGETGKSEELGQKEHNFIESKGNLEAKLSSTLAGIEEQMQAFWTKLYEIEQAKYATIFQPDLKLVNEVEERIKSEYVKPHIKPRSKFSQPTHNKIATSNNAENLKLEIDKLEQQNFEQNRSQDRHNEIQLVKQGNSISEPQLTKSTHILPGTRVSDELSDESKLEKESSLESDTSETESLSVVQNDEVLAKPSASFIEKRPVRSINKINSDTRILKNLNKEIQEVVFSRIQELGISRSWSGIPQRTFEKSLEILNHQTALTRRTYSNFDSLKKDISSNVETECAKKTTSKTELKTTPERKTTGKSQNMIKIYCKQKSDKSTVNQRNLNVSSKRETAEIKNRALYDTDTESEKNIPTYTKVIASTSQPHQMYSDVVNEYKSLRNVILQKNQDSDIDDLNKNGDLQKGVLKSFPSVGSLSKKKVLFDLDSDSSKRGDAPVIQKTGDSTTSIASSVLENSLKGAKECVEDKEGSKSNEKEGNKDQEKYLNDLTNFDISDL